MSANGDSDHGGDQEIAQDDVAPTPRLQRNSYKYPDPPIIFTEIDGLAAINKIDELCSQYLNPQQQHLLGEIRVFLETGTDAWIIGDEHIDLILHLLENPDKNFCPNISLFTLEVLQAAALKDDFVLVLHQDRKNHRIMSYINTIEYLTLAEQEEIIKFLCNLCGQPTTFDWLFYISEWAEKDSHGQSSSNYRVTVRAAVHTLLNDRLTQLQRNGVFLIYNLSLKDVFDDVAIELSTAILQYLLADVSEDLALLCLTALARFIAINNTEIPVLVKMLNPNLSKFKGQSEKADSLVDEIQVEVDKVKF